MIPVLAFLIALAAGPAPAWQDADAPPPPPPVEVQEEQEEQVQVPDGYQPGQMVNQRSASIMDMSSHRAGSVPFVWGAGEVVRLDLDGVDIQADPVLMIGDEPVSRAEFRRRALLFASAGDLDRHVLRVITAHELARREAAGEAVPDMAVSEEEIAAKFKEYEDVQIMQLQQQGLTGAELEEAAERTREQFKQSIEMGMGMEAFQRLLVADAEFERVFLPLPELTEAEKQAKQLEAEARKAAGDPIPPTVTITEDTEKPEWMPQLTWDAFMSSTQAQGLLGFVLSQAEYGNELPSLFKPSIVGTLKAGLMEAAGVEYFFDIDLPDEVLVRVGGQDVKTDEVWLLVNPQLTDTDVHQILRELVVLRTARKNFDAAGAWLEGERWDYAWGAHEAEFEGTLLPLRTVIMFKGYHSYDRYREHYRYRASYDYWQKLTLTEDEVLDHYQGGGRFFFEKGEPVLEPVFLPVTEHTEAAYDAALAEMAAFIAANEGDWDAVREKYPFTAPDGSSTLKAQRNMLRIQMRESELTQIITGYGLLHDLFYNGEVGDVFGPWANKVKFHAWGQQPGVWAVRIKDFTLRGSLPAWQEGDRNFLLAFEDYLNLAYLDWLERGLEQVAPSVRVPG